MIAKRKTLAERIVQTIYTRHTAFIRFKPEPMRTSQLYAIVRRVLARAPELRALRTLIAAIDICERTHGASVLDLYAARDAARKALGALP